MNEIVIVAISGSGVLGGAETYAIRILKWLTANGYRTFLMHKENENFSQTVKESFDSIGVERIILPTLKSNGVLPDFTKVQVDFPKGSNIRIICFQSPFNFFAAECIKHKAKGCQVNTFQYMIHEADFCRNKTQKSTNRMLQNVLKQVYKRLLVKMEKKNNVIYMVEDYLRTIHENYDLQTTENTLPIIRLGIDIKKVDMELASNKYNNRPFVILTMTRFEFPTKGYVLGLIDEFAKVFEKFPFTRLWIIGAGPDEDQLVKKIASQKSEIKEAIRLIGPVPYDELQPYFLKASLFVGMATCLLDSSNNGVLSIPTRVNRCDCISSGLFYENPYDLIGYVGETPVSNILERVLSMGEQGFEKAVKSNYTALKETYDIDSIMRQLLSCENKSTAPTLSMITLYLLKYGRICIDFILNTKKKKH